MSEEIMKSILQTIQDNFEKEIDKIQEQKIEEFKEKLRLEKINIISDVMKNVVVSFNQDRDIISFNISTKFKEEI